MNKTKEAFVLGAILCCGLTLSAKAAPAIALNQWGINNDATVYTTVGSLPGSINGGGFDFTTGLGTISASITGPGLHYFSLFLDHAIDQAINTSLNEFGTAFGAPAAGQSWEVDDPVLGNIHANFLAGTLDNAIGAGAPHDVSMALGWNFLLAGGETAAITMRVANAPPAGFYLVQTDPDSEASIYFSSSLAIAPTSVPDSVHTLACLSLALAGLSALRRRLGS